MAETLQFRAMIIQYGPVPPASGPAREQYMLTNGASQLRTADEEYTTALAFLSDWTELVPNLFSPLESNDEELRDSIVEKSRTEWESLKTEIPHGVLELAEPHIRASEKAAVNALNYLEDTHIAGDAHKAVHRAAFLRRGLFGCPITYREGQFWSDCSINISHLRLGMSVGITSDFHCSICDEKLEDCDHVMGQEYLVAAKTNPQGLCSICELPTCSHQQGERYAVAAQGVGREISLHEVSMVSRPRYPLARITEMTRDLPQEYRSIGKAGLLHCDACLGPCRGFNESADWNL